MKMNELMIYQVFPLRALTDGQPSHGILEMIDWIQHIKKLGMNAVYFSPVFSTIGMILQIIIKLMSFLVMRKILNIYVKRQKRKVFPLF